ncbi:MAG TPA: glycosyltransferase family 2 protein [Arachidicoccus sp.]|nr:glycosyltransferase family 2 protein [Arachidicoccus sp.]
MDHPLVAVVILNYNGRNFLEKFLPSVLASTYTKFKVIVADNNSTDDSVAFLESNYPSLELITLKQNFGFAEGYNQALKGVDAGYFVLLNSDVEVQPGWIEPVIEMMEMDTKVAVCQPKILSYHHKNEFEYAGAAGGWIDFLGYPFARGRVFDQLEKDSGQYKDSNTVFWATGAAMFVKASVYNEVGGLYGAFFAHQEEIDFCWRTQNAGYKIACCTASTVYHVGGGTLPKGHRKTFLNFRNNLMMLSRNLPRNEKWWKIPLRLVLDGVFAVKCLLSRDLTSVRAIWNAHMAYYHWSSNNKEVITKKRRPMKALSGVLNKSLVLQYFVFKKKKFEDFSK